MVVFNHLCLGQTLVPNAFIDRYLAAAGGDAVKVYIMLLRQSDSEVPTVEMLAESLDLTSKAVLRALTYWQQQGLLDLVREGDEVTQITLLSPAMDSDAAPRSRKAAASGNAAPSAPGAQQTAAPVKVNVTDMKFRELVYVAEQFLGRTLTRTDTNFIIWLQEEMGFSEELVEYLLEYCVDKGHSKVSYMKAVALGWKEAGVTDVESARAQAASFDEGVRRSTRPAANKFHNFDQRDTDLNAMLLQELRGEGQ